MKIKLIFGALAACAIAFGIQEWRMNSLRGEVLILTANNSKLTYALDEQSAAMQSLQDNIQHAIDNSNRLAKELGVVESHRRHITNELSSYRGRLNAIAIKKPTLIARRANDAFGRLLREAESIGD